MRVQEIVNVTRVSLTFYFKSIYKLYDCVMPAWMLQHTDNTDPIDKQNGYNRLLCAKCGLQR